MQRLLVIHRCLMVHTVNTLMQRLEA
jgi:hypothetical protein